ncbi:MAG TPA: SDR family NAD(P)-dependent oxidoreductase, partial [Pyrinomonadaceae bacterium]|nr:SDR family NAD(P)-dependent oxidoreductase [Pyrinomonadaceae bacterium]
MDNGFAGKSVIVTGATSGIGQAVARAFRSNGAHVAAIGRNEVALNDLYAADGKVLRVPADVTDSDDLGTVVEAVIRTFGRLDVLVNAAGHISSGTIENTDLAAWDAMMNVNLRAPFQFMQLCAPHLIEAKGNIVNISSVTGLRSFPGVLAYCVSKAGLDQLTR